MASIDLDRIRLTDTLRGRPERGHMYRIVAYAGDVVGVEGVSQGSGPMGRETETLVTTSDGSRWWVNANLLGGDPA